MLKAHDVTKEKFYVLNTQTESTAIPYPLGLQRWARHIPGQGDRWGWWSCLHQTFWNSQSTTQAAPGPCPCPHRQLGSCRESVHLGHCLHISHHTKRIFNQHMKWISVMTLCGPKSSHQCGPQSPHIVDFNQWSSIITLIGLQSSCQVHFNQGTSVITPSGLSHCTKWTSTSGL